MITTWLVLIQFHVDDPLDACAGTLSLYSFLIKTCNQLYNRDMPLPPNLQISQYQTVLHRSNLQSAIFIAELLGNNCFPYLKRKV